MRDHWDGINKPTTITDNIGKGISMCLHSPVLLSLAGDIEELQYERRQFAGGCDVPTRIDGLAPH